MTAPDVHCTCMGTCHPEVEPYCAWCTDGIDEAPYCGNPGCKPEEIAYWARILAATDHIGRGTRKEHHV